MANVRGMREAFLKAQKYERDWSDYLAAKQREPAEKGRGDGDKESEKDRPKMPERDLAMETLVLVLRGDALVQWHCYQADDMLAALQIANEFGFKVRSFHHALEAYK